MHHNLHYYHFDFIIISIKLNSLHRYINSLLKQSYSKFCDNYSKAFKRSAKPCDLGHYDDTLLIKPKLVENIHKPLSYKPFRESEMFQFVSDFNDKDQETRKSRIIKLYIHSLLFSTHLILYLNFSGLTFLYHIFCYYFLIFLVKS